MRTERLRRQQAAYYKINAEKLKAKAIKWNREHPERRKIIVANWQRRNSESCNRKHREWMRKHPEVRIRNEHSRRARIKGSGGNYTESQWIELCRKYRWRCLCCRKRKKLTPDHVVPLCKGGNNTISNLQPLCRSCNVKKGVKKVDYRRKYA